MLLEMRDKKCYVHRTQKSSGNNQLNYCLTGELQSLGQTTNAATFFNERTMNIRNDFLHGREKEQKLCVSTSSAFFPLPLVPILGKRQD